jgi:NADH-quinone oxidoreductase subunit A
MLVPTGQMHDGWRVVTGSEALAGGGFFVNDAYLTQYLFLTVFLVVAILFPVAPLVLARLLAPHKPARTKNDTYECGLAARGDAWLQFRVGYYLYALVYVIFAVESVFLYPWAVAFAGLNFASFVAVMIFVLLLVEGLVYAWAKGALDWK